MPPRTKELNSLEVTLNGRSLRESILQVAAFSLCLTVENPTTIKAISERADIRYGIVRNAVGVLHAAEFLNVEHVARRGLHMIPARLSPTERLRYEAGKCMGLQNEIAICERRLETGFNREQIICQALVALAQQSAQVQSVPHEA